MKNSQVAVLLVGAVVVTAGIQEWRISQLKDGASPVESIPIPKREGPNSKVLSGNSEVPRRSASGVIENADAPEKDDESFPKSIRKMWDNPAGKSMMNQGVKMAVAMMYEDYIETLNLTDEEAKHFRELLGSEMATQQEIGMKMMGATAEERKELAKEMAERSKQNEEDIKTFLNNEEDFESFKSYKERLPERQQLEGVRASMAAKGAAMDEDTESKLVDAMFKARSQPGLADFSKNGGLEEIGREGMIERFESAWESQQEMLRDEVGFLSEAQTEAFFEHQDQMKEFQMMGLKMAEKMMGGEE